MLDSNQSTNSFISKLKFVILGDAAVGKTCLVFRFITGDFFSEYVPTVIDHNMTQRKIGKSYVNLELWDTAGQEDYNNMRKLCYKHADLFIIVLSVVDRNSLTHAVERWYTDLKEENKEANVIFVGNKTDLRNKKGLASGEHLARDSIEEMTNKLECPYFECSALSKEGVEEFFVEGAKICLKKRKEYVPFEEFDNKGPLGCCSKGSGCILF